MRAILADDERVGRARLRRMLEREPDIEVVAECADGLAAVESVRELHPDLLFLDINMPGMDGFDVLEKINPAPLPIVIFVTSYDEHAVRAFEACALDYLLKPVSPERLAKTLARARPHFAAAVAAGVPANAPALARDETNVVAPARFVVRSGGRVSFVAVEEIDWVEAAGNYAVFHVGKQNHMVRETMASLEGQLPPDSFLRVSRSAILNLRRVKELYTSPVGNHAAILTDTQRVPITRSVREVADRLSMV